MALVYIPGFDGNGNSVVLIAGADSSSRASPAHTPLDQNGIPFGVVGNPFITSQQSPTLTSRSIAAANTNVGQSATLITNNPNRAILIFQCGGPIWLNLVGGAASANGLDCVYVPAESMQQFSITNAINYFLAAPFNITLLEG